MVLGKNAVCLYCVLQEFDLRYLKNMYIVFFVGSDYEAVRLSVSELVPLALCWWEMASRSRLPSAVCARWAGVSGRRWPFCTGGRVDGVCRPAFPVLKLRNYLWRQALTVECSVHNTPFSVPQARGR